MQFTTSTIVLVASLMASSASGMPVELSQRAQMCGSTPSASGSQTPLSSPTAATADACKALCSAQSGCLSFVFGLPASASAPTCELFNVAAASIPAQTTNLEVFDVACTSIPTTAPTTANPVGTVGSTTGSNGGSTTGGNTGSTGGNTGSTGGNTGSTGGNTGSTGGNTGSTGGNTGSTGGATTTGGAAGGNGGAPKEKRASCGAAPAGPSTAKASPLKTDKTVASSADCLALCKATANCQSVEFGKPSNGAAAQCMLFSTSAAQLPPAANGASLAAFDVGC